jgi:seryl-tRNA synthetase
MSRGPQDKFLRNRLHTAAAIASAVAIAMLTARTVAAQTPRSGGGASAELYQQLQQLSSERTSLQADNERMKKELDDMRKERDALKSAQKGLGARAQTAEAELAQSATQRESLQGQLDRMKAQMQELIGKFRDTITTFRQVEADRNGTKQTLAARERDLKVCMDRNAALYRLNDEVLTRWDRETVWSRVARTEPFTKLARVRLENLLDDYKTRANTERLATPDVPPVPASTTPGRPSAPVQSAAPVPAAPASTESSPPH